MRNSKKIILWGIPALTLWGFFFLVQRIDGNNLSERLILALSYVGSIVIALTIIQKFLINRVRIFKPSIQILTKVLFYGAAILIGYLPVFLGEIIYRVSAKDIVNEIVYGISKAISALFTIPVSDLQYSQFFPPEAISILISIFVLLLLIAIVATGLSYVDTKWTQFRAESKIRDSRLKILEMQMEPHFLFNSINAISSLIKPNPNQAQELLIRLAEFLRYNFNLGDRAEVTLDEELRLTENYLWLSQARFGEELTWEIDVTEEGRQIKMPGMMIQPLAENAIKHGWLRDKRPLHIGIKFRKQHGSYLITVFDNGQGIRQDIFNSPGFPPPGHALHNIIERLQIKYFKTNPLAITSEHNAGTTITISIPEKK